MTSSTAVVSGGARARSPAASLIQERGRRLLNDPRVRSLLRLMIEGEDVKVAAKQSRLTTMRARLILQDATVRRAYFKGMEVLRESERARNIALAVEVRNRGLDVAAGAAARKVALDAARYLDGDHGAGGTSTSVSVSVTNVVGYVMDLREDGDAMGNRSASGAKPLIEHAHVAESER